MIGGHHQPSVGRRNDASSRLIFPRHPSPQVPIPQVSVTPDNFSPHPANADSTSKPGWPNHPPKNPMPRRAPSSSRRRRVAVE